jgi:hypothetical protein
MGGWYVSWIGRHVGYHGLYRLRDLLHMRRTWRCAKCGAVNGLLMLKCWTCKEPRPTVAEHVAEHGEAEAMGRTMPER